MLNPAIDYTFLSKKKKLWRVIAGARTSAQKQLAPSSTRSLSLIHFGFFDYCNVCSLGNVANMQFEVRISIWLNPHSLQSPRFPANHFGLSSYSAVRIDFQLSLSLTDGMAFQQACCLPHVAHTVPSVHTHTSHVSHIAWRAPDKEHWRVDMKSNSMYNTPEILPMSKSM